MHGRLRLICRKQRLVSTANLKCKARVRDKVEEARAAARREISTYFGRTLHVSEVGGGAQDLSFNHQRMTVCGMIILGTEGPRKWKTREI